MTSKQNAWLQMFAAVRATVLAHVAAWTGFTSFATPWATFLALLTQIEGDLALQESDSTGVTENKALLRAALTARMQQIGDALILVAENTVNRQLREDAYMGIAEMNKIQEKALLGHYNKLQTLVTANAAAVVPFGITAAFMTATNTAATNFATAVGSPRHIIAEGARGTEQLDAHIAQMLQMLDGPLDAAAKVLSYTQPAFFSEYSTSRIIVDAGTSTRALEVTVKDDSTAEPLANATAIINPGAIEKVSGAQGKFYIQSLAAGHYTMVVNKPGYSGFSIEFDADPLEGVQLLVSLHTA